MGLKDWDGDAWTGLIWFRRARGLVGACGCGKESSGCIKYGNSLD
jgi:hypothetical protein